MNTQERQTFDQLILATRKLVTMCNLAGETISERFQGMVAEPVAEVEAVLAKCPAPGSVWDGSVRDEDVEEEVFLAIDQAAHEEPRGVRLKHTITGIVRESYIGRRQADNRVSARNSLAEAVQQRFDSMGK